MLTTAAGVEADLSASAKATADPPKRLREGGQVGLGRPKGRDLPTLDGRPFGPAVDQRFLYPSRSYARTVEEVRQALRRRDGLIVVTGDAGTGKTLLCRTLLQEMEEAAFVSVVLDPRVAEDDLVAHILTDFGVTRADLPMPAHVRRRALTAALQGFLRELIPMNGYAVVIVDEAQHLSPGVLELLRLLMNFETDEAKLLQVVLVGQRDLEHRLREPEMQGLDQRVARRCEMQPLSAFEVKRYIERRLSTAQHLAGTWHGTFTPSAARAVAAVSNGVPRVVNRVCDLALEIGHERRTRIIDARTVRAAARRLRIDAGPRQWPWRTTAAATAVFTALAGAAMTTWGPAFAGSAQEETRTTSSAAADRPAAAHAAQAPAVAEEPLIGTLPLSNSITVTVGSFKTPDRAAAVAKQIQALALPAFTRVRDGQWHQVVVGPYVTEAEATAAQRGLAAHGFTGSRTLVEPAQPKGVAESWSDDRRALLLPSPGRMSLVLQLAEEPKKVVTRQLDRSTVEIDLGPVVTAQRAERLNAAAGVPVVAQVHLESVLAHGRELLMRVRVALNGTSRNDVRVVGRRVYVDFTPASPHAGNTRVDTGNTPVETNAFTAAGSRGVRLKADPAFPSVERAAPADPVRTYDAAVSPVLARLEEVGPFLLSATAAPTPEVLAALGRMFSEVQDSLHAIDAPPAAERSHALLLSAVAEARRSVEREFSGDRVMQARQAIALWTAAAEGKES